MTAPKRQKEGEDKASLELKSKNVNGRIECTQAAIRGLWKLLAILGAAILAGNSAGIIEWLKSL